jgi:hypothetical protein
MSAGLFMDLSQESDSVLLRYAPLENTCSATFVEFSVDYCEGLGALYDLSMMDGIFWEFASHQVGQVRLRPDYFDEHDCSCAFGKAFCSRCWG